MAELTLENVDGLSFEQAFTQLGEIVDELDSDAVTLDDLVVKYELGMKLLRVCQGRLESARQRVEFIGKPGAAPLAETRSSKKQDSRDDLRLL